MLGKEPKVTLIGAGPGAVDIITVRGARVLQQAGAILYDALVNTEFLHLDPAEVPRIYVGKWAGQHE